MKIMTKPPRKISLCPLVRKKAWFHCKNYRLCHTIRHFSKTHFFLLINDYFYCFNIIHISVISSIFFAISSNGTPCAYFFWYLCCLCVITSQHLFTSGPVNFNQYSLAISSYSNSRAKFFYHAAIYLNNPGYDSSCYMHYHSLYTEKILEYLRYKFLWINASTTNA